MGLTLPMNVGLIGLGRMGAEPSERLEGKLPPGWLPLSHAEAIQATPGLKLDAICDQDTERLQKIRQHYHVGKAYTDYKEMIQATAPGVVSIATRTAGRCEIIEYAIEHGTRGIYVEKPLSRTVGEARYAIGKVIRENVKLAYGATRRAMPVYRKARDIVASGELGELQQINVEFGKSPLLWTLPHAIDLILFYAGTIELEWLTGICELTGWDSKTNTLDSDPEVLHAYFQFRNNVSGVLTQASGFSVRLACTKGIVTVHGDGSFIEISRPGKVSWYFHEQERITVDSPKSGIQLIFEDMVESLVSDKPMNVIQPEEILLNQQMLFGIVTSSVMKGAKTDINQIDEALTITGRLGNNFA